MTAERRKPREGRIARERKAAVLKAAVRVFLKKGLKATSVSDIIAEAGGSKASIYGHFHSKEGLFAEVIRHQIESRSGAFLELSDTVSSTEVTLSSIGMQFLGLILDDTSRALQTIVAHEAKKFPELGRLFLEHGPKQLVRPLSAFIKRAHENGGLCAPDPEMAAWQFMLLCQAKYAYPSLIAGMPSPSKKAVSTGSRRGCADFHGGLRCIPAIGSIKRPIICGRHSAYPLATANRSPILRLIRSVIDP